MYDEHYMSKFQQALTARFQNWGVFSQCIFNAQFSNSDDNLMALPKQP